MDVRQISFKSNCRQIGMTLFLFCLPIGLYLAILITSYYKTGQLQWSASVTKSAFYFGVACLISIPGFLLHYNHCRHDKGKELRFDANYLELKDQMQTFRIPYKDIQKVEYHFSSWSRRLPWKDYGYINLILKDGQTVKFTYLLSDPISSKAYFDNHNIAVDEVEDLYTWVN